MAKATYRKLNLVYALVFFALSLNVKPFLPVRHVNHVTVEMSVSVYVPRAGGINGKACYNKPVSACFVQTGDAACGWKYPKGTIFVLPDSMVVLGFPAVVRCWDRGDAIGDSNLDIALVSEHIEADVIKANDFGREWLRVGMIIPR